MKPFHELSFKELREVLTPEMKEVKPKATMFYIDKFGNKQDIEIKGRLFFIPQFISCIRLSDNASIAIHYSLIKTYA